MMKKLLFLIGSLGKGGAEKVLIDTVNTLCHEGIEVSVLSIEGGEVHEKDLDSRIQYRSIINENIKILRGIHYRLLVAAPSKWIYNHYIPNEDKYDYMIAFLEGLPTKIVSNSSVTKYAWVHTNLQKNFGSLASYSSFQQNCLCYKQFDRIICVSESARNGFIGKFGDGYNIDVIYNLLDENLVIQKSKEKIISDEHWDEKHINLVSIGRLSEEKGFDRLIRITRRLREKNDKFTLRIIGDGKEKEKLEEMIKHYNLQNTVLLVGYKENPYPYIRKSDALICSSREEGFSTVVTEALILGKPVITTDCAGMKEQFGNSSCGIIVENKEDSLYEAIDKYLNDEKLRAEYQSQAEIRGSYFKIEKRKKELLKLFE